MSEVSQFVVGLMHQRGTHAEHLVLSAADCQGLSAASRNDAHDYWYSGLVSFGEACAAAQRSSFAWATIKSYYAAFYLSRAFLGFTGASIEYLHTQNKLRHIAVVANPGSSPRRVTGNTHDSILKEVEASGAIPRLRGQPVAGQDVASWLIGSRNSANYTIARFPDPEPTTVLESVAKNGVRRSLQAYVEDDSQLYPFDPDHAMMAYPVAVAKELISAEPPDFSDADEGHLSALFRDQAGPFAFARQLYRRV